MTPSYTPWRFANTPPLPTFETLLREVPWLTVREARSECFMAHELFKYTYGVDSYAKTYVSVPYHPIVDAIEQALNADGFAYNVCFLNRYDTQKHQLGWHADDSPGMLHEHPIAVVSFGAEREIWWRENGQKGVIPQDQRQLLGKGSLFVMPPGFQRTHQHRIPKSDRTCGARVSLTFRRYVP